MWITIRLKSRRLVDRSMSVGRQPGKPGWLGMVVNLTGGTARRLVPLRYREHTSKYRVKLIQITHELSIRYVNTTAL